MPTSLTELPPRAEPRRKLWTRAEVDALSSTGLFDQQKMELVEGELINQMGKLPPHVNSLILLLEWLSGIFGVRFIRPESPISVAPEDNHTSEPQPDLAVLKRDNLHFTAAHPAADDRPSRPARRAIRFCSGLQR